MAHIFPVGKNKWEWFPKAAQVIEEDVNVDVAPTNGEVPPVGAEPEADADADFNPNFEAVKDLPIFGDDAAVDGAPVEEASPALPEAAPVTDTAVNVTPEEAKSVKEEVKDVADAAKDVAEKAEQLFVKLEEAAGGEEGEGGDKAPKGEGEVEEIEIEITPDEGGDADPGAKVESEPDKESKCGCGTPMASGSEKKPESKEEKKDEPKAGEKMEKEGKPESKEASAKKEFVRISHTTSQTKKEIREYWTALGMPAEFVNAMTKDYD